MSADQTTASTPDDAPPVEGRALPDVEPTYAPFWEGAAAGELRYQECPACGHRQFYPRAVCTACAAEPEWRTASGRGTVHTYTVIRQNWAEPFRGLVPYVVAMIDLEEGPRMMSNVTGCEPEDVRIGMAVEAYSVPVEDGIGLWFWRPAEG